eukprot:3133083-Prymnesium_polylepis.1
MRTGRRRLDVAKLLGRGVTGGDRGVMREREHFEAVSLLGRTVHRGCLMKADGCSVIAAGCSLKQIPGSSNQITKRPRGGE